MLTSAASCLCTCELRLCLLQRACMARWAWCGPASTWLPGQRLYWMMGGCVSGGCCSFSLTPPVHRDPSADQAPLQLSTWAVACIAYALGLRTGDNSQALSAS